MCNCKVALIVSIIVGIVLIIVAAVLGFAVLPGVIDDTIDDNVILNSKDTEQFERFEKLPFALNFTVRFFNVQNPEAIMNGKKPNVTEMQAIIYSKAIEKHDIEFLSDTQTIHYYNIKNHTYEETYSDISENEIITVVNTPLVGVMQIFENLAEKLGPIGNYLNGKLIKGYNVAFGQKPGTIFHQVKVGDYAFKGYKFCNRNNMPDDLEAKFVCGLIRLLAPPTMEISSDASGEISFSFFNQKEGREEGDYEVYQGSDDISKLGQIKQWNNAPRTTFWREEEGDTCNEIKGTDSTIYKPHNDKDSRFTIFNTDICRKVELAFTEEIEYEGIPGYRSSLTKDNMNWSLPENSCYCLNQTRNLKGELSCHPSGFTDLYSCLHAPLLLSLPHFLWAEDESYVKSVDGLNPVEEDHKIYIDMEPNTGSPMVGHKRVQFNMVLRNYNIGDDTLQKIKPAILPIVWIDENVQIPENMVQLIKDQYLIPVTAIDISKWVLIGVGIALTIGGAALYACKRKSFNSSETV